MTQQTTQSTAAWGMELRAGGAVLQRVEQDANGALVVQQAKEIAGGPNSGGLGWDPALLDALVQVPADEPLGICFPDRVMMCRGLSLPPAAIDVTEKMVNAQAAALFFDGSDRLKTAWQSAAHPFDASMQWIVISAIQRRWIDELIKSLPPQVSLRCLMPRAFAVPVAASDAAVKLQIDVDTDSMSFNLAAGDNVLRVLSLDRDEENAAEWRLALRHTYLSLLESIPRNQWPTVGLLSASGSQDPQSLAAQLADVLGIELRLVERVSGAAAVAARVLQPSTIDPSINFAEPLAPLPRAVPIPPRLVARAAAAVLAGIVAWYGIDCFRDWSLSRKFQQLRDAEASAGGVERRLAVNKYLERNVSPALIIFDIILSSAPPSLNMTSFGVAAAGQVHLSGTVGSASELDDLMRKLQTSPALTNVQLRSAKIEQNRWSIDMTADAKPMSGLMPATPTPPKPSGSKLALAGGA